MPVDTSTPRLRPAGDRAVGAGRRADLDGLRGLAIGLVVVFHVWFGRVSGGVDVFLALSGYFFVGALLRVTESTAPLDPRPVLRRVGRRLLAPLVLVLIAVTAAQVVLTPPTGWFSTAEQTFASLTFLQNWHLAHAANDYLAADPSVSPMQHLWSIAVQGQFYVAALVVVFTLAGVLRRRGLSTRTPLAVLLVVVTAASFGYAAFSSAGPTWLYYDSAARLWELTLGGLFVCVAPWLRVPRWTAATLAVLALLVLLGCGAVLDGRAQFPGPWALVPVGAALLLVVTGTTRPTAVSRLLASAPLMWLGAIAYALYLWHWPVLITYLVVRDRLSVGAFGGLVVIALSLVLAEATTRLVEDPIRTGTPSCKRTSLVAALTTAGVALAAVSVGWVQYVDRSARQIADLPGLSDEVYPGAGVFDIHPDPVSAPVKPPLMVAEHDLPATTTDHCIAAPGQREAVSCTYGDPTASRRIALTGGSHSEHWLPALDLLGKEHRFRVDTYVKVGCPLSDPLTPLTEDSVTVDCDTWSKNVLAALAADPPDYVFTTSTRPREAGAGPGDYTPGWYVALWETLTSYDIQVLAIRDTPWLQDDGIPYRASDCLARGGDAYACGVARADALDVVDPAREAAAHLPTVHPLDLSDVVCRADRCLAVEGNVLIYRDRDHLTTVYVRTLAPELGRQLRTITDWW
ncbi:acyltransferase family protein [Rhodococcus zopfii]|uniref:acyltransferase family protein n=1 Tax=Rhodococcus zopfii TaxID=43772 RepID=UPI000934953D|nr:acyltransferase family protein [Rhodococcus zopfii]